MPVPLTDFTDKDIRDEIVAHGGSVPASGYTYEDLLAAALIGRFCEDFLEGSTDKSTIIKSDQWRCYGAVKPIANESSRAYNWTIYPPETDPRLTLTITAFVSNYNPATMSSFVNVHAIDGGDFSMGSVSTLPSTEYEIKIKDVNIVAWIDIRYRFLYSSGCPASENIIRYYS